MGFYSNTIFPKIINLVMSDKQMTKARKDVLSDASGKVFELGFGTGLNLPHYPENVKRIVCADPNPGMLKAAQERIQASPIEVDYKLLRGEDLPFEDESFDCIVCTWTLCSIADVEKALAQCHRVLKPEGKFLFVEHGLADAPAVQRWQNRLNPIWGLIGDGCNLNRNIRELIQDCRFTFGKLDNFYMKGAPRFAGYMYQGLALKA